MIMTSTNSLLKAVFLLAIFIQVQFAGCSTPDNDVISGAEDQSVLSRRQILWDYDPNYEWENGGKEYTLPGEEKKETNFERLAKNWQKNAIKIIFLGSFCCMVVCCCLACIKKICMKSCGVVCMHCKEWRDLCLNRDPTYRMARKMADDFGIELDYDHYKKIKNNYEEALKKEGYGSQIDLSGR